MTRCKPLPTLNRSFSSSWWPVAARWPVRSQRLPTLALELLEDRLAPAGGVAAYQLALDAPGGFVTPGKSFAIQVTPVDAKNQPFPTGLDIVGFSSSDPEACLPPSFDFTTSNSSPSGSYCIGGFYLSTAGAQYIDLDDPGNGLTATLPITVNSPPTGLEAAINVPGYSYGSPLVFLNQQFSVSGSFQDTGNGAHTVTINWGAGQPSTITLPPGVFSFNVNHAYDSSDGIPNDTIVSEPITVSVSNAYGSDLASPLSIAVFNLSPQVFLSGDQIGNVGQTMTASGYFTGGYVDETVTVNYGDGSPLQTVPYSDGANQFSLQHVYTSDGSFPVTVTVTDYAGETGQSSFYANIFLPGVETVQELAVAPGQTGTLQVAGGTVTLTHAAGSAGDAILLLALVPETSGVSLPNSSFLGSSSLEVTSYDLRVTNASPLDSALVTFDYTASTNNEPAFTFFNSTLGVQQPIPASQYTTDLADHTITMVLDNSTTPRLVDTTGTVFTIAVPLEIPVQGPPQARDQPPTQVQDPPQVEDPVQIQAQDPVQNQAQTAQPQEAEAELSPVSPVVFPANVAASTPQSSTAASGSVGTVTGSVAVVFAGPIVGGDGQLGDDARVDTGRLADLPPVAGPLISSPAAVISPPRIVPPEPPDSATSAEQQPGAQDREITQEEPGDQKPESPRQATGTAGGSGEDTRVSDTIFARLTPWPSKTSPDNRGQLLLVAAALFASRLGEQGRDTSSKRKF